MWIEITADQLQEGDFVEMFIWRNSKYKLEHPKLVEHSVILKIESIFNQNQSEFEVKFDHSRFTVPFKSNDKVRILDVTEIGYGV